MKLIVLGATGGTGLELIRQALERGHSLTAFVRSTDRLKPFRDRISIKQGDLLNSAELEQVVQGHDAVLSGFGPRVPISKADATLLHRFAVALTNAMPHAGVRRVVVESVAFLFRDSIVPPTYLFGRLFFPGTVADASAMEQLLTESKFRFQNLAGGCRRFHDQGGRESLLDPQNRRGLQLIASGTRWNES